MVATRTWRPSHSVDGPFRARLDDIADLVIRHDIGETLGPFVGN